MQTVIRKPHKGFAFLLDVSLSLETNQNIYVELPVMKYEIERKFCKLLRSKSSRGWRHDSETVLPEDLSSVPSTHIGRLASNSSAGNLRSSSGPHRFLVHMSIPTQTQTHPHRHKCTHTNKRTINLENVMNDTF